ncbi:MAG: hypothetical protein KC422_10210 [Trueperaceae bacterium]|nr:hypothetical protein [Trueperaceae bacterium]
MNRFITALLLLALLLLAACGGGNKAIVSPTPTPEEPSPEPEPGTENPPSLAASLVKLEFSAAAIDQGAQIVKPLAGSDSVMLVAKRFNRFEAEGNHYLSLTVELVNQACAGCAANSSRPEISLLAVTDSSRLLGTPFASFKSSDGKTVGSGLAATQATGLRPIHGMNLTERGPKVLDDEASFQAYSEEALAAFKTLVPEGYTLLPYGFSAAKTGTSVNSLGQLTLAFKLPANLGSTPPIFGMTLLATVQSKKQVTESLEEQGTDAALTRAKASGASLTVLGNSPSRADKRLCSLALSRADKPVYLLNQATCQPVTSVSSFLDEQDGDFSIGQLSLREALARANDGQLIQFSDEVLAHEGGILLDSKLGPLEFRKSITLDASQPLILDAQKAMELATLHSGITLNLNNLRFQNGKTAASGAAFSIPEGTTVTLKGAEFKANLASKDGGAIYNEGTLELNDTVFLGNVSLEDGGAFANLGTVRASGVYFLENKATGAGGAIFNASEAENTFVNVQFSQNKADYGGALFHRFGRLELRYASIYANEAVRDGGGLFVNSANSQIGVHASLIAHNLDAAQKLFQDVYVSGSSNPFESSYNLIGLGDSQGFFATELASTKNQVGTSLSAYLEPEVDWNPVADTLNTLLPKAKSPLLNAVPAGVLGCDSSLKDITGAARGVASACDIGAYEAR